VESRTARLRLGTPNKTTAEIEELAHKHGPDAIEELARLGRMPLPVAGY
jgi:hypothetical protein